MPANGDTDVGALARIGRAQRLQALALVEEGRVYDLGLDINERMPMGPPHAFVPFSRRFSATASASEPFEYAAEAIEATPHTSTHIDALVHVQEKGAIYGGALEAETRTDAGFSRHGAETIPPILGRAVLIDVAALKGVEALEDGYEIGVGDLREALERAGLAVEQGDVVLVRTGKLREFWSAPAAFHERQPGVGVEAAEWLFDAGMAVLGTDTAGTEPMPIADRDRVTHVAMLVRRGVHLIENVALDEPCRDGVTVGLFVCLPLRITGATGSWVRPVLVV
jgi:kynurenine formamidase